MGVDAPGTAVRHLIQRPPLFPLDNPAIVSAPLGFAAAVVGTLVGRDPDAAARYSELRVRANTGMGAV
jgi:cation/acetate symporter